MPPTQAKQHDTRYTNPQWDDACLTIRIAKAIASSNLPVMPVICIKAHAGPVIDKWLQLLEAALPQMPVRRLPIGATRADLVGGLDLSATIATGKRVSERGLIERCDGGIMVARLSSPLMSDAVASLNQAIDHCDNQQPDEQTIVRKPSGFSLVMIDEGSDGESFLPAALQDRATFHLDLTQVRFCDAIDFDHEAETHTIVPALCDASIIEELCVASLSIGLTSMRPPYQALQIVMFNAALNDRQSVTADDLNTAFRLGLVNRALYLPTDEPEEPSEEHTEPDQDDIDHNDEPKNNSGEFPEEIDVNSMLASLPAELLTNLKRSSKSKRRQQSTGQSGGQRVSFKRGRPMPSTAGDYHKGKGIDLLATLREAAPFQTIRRQRAINSNALQIRMRDIRIKRFMMPAETTTIFIVDASGSTAINRLGEAKGAVEILLGESYSRRDHVALISLRGTQAELVLPPTRSLTRARKTLTALRGGGGTPLAHGIKLAQQIASEELRRGRTPNLVLLTDGSANISLDGSVNRANAMDEALQMAKQTATLDVGILVIDVGRVSNGNAQRVCDAMQAHYLKMPFANSQKISEAVRLCNT
ncbi:MAG: VWA domain-containing protein [Pseudomonadota bacterium]